MGACLINPKKIIFLSKKETNAIKHKRKNEKNKKNFISNFLLKSFFFNGCDIKTTAHINIKINKKYFVRLNDAIRHGTSK